MDGSSHRAVSDSMSSATHAEERFARVTGWTVFHWACLDGDLKWVKYLVEDAGANAAEKTTPHEWTGLQLACLRNHVPVVKYLLKSGRCNLEATNRGGWTALDNACAAIYKEFFHYVTVQSTLAAKLASMSGAARTAAAAGELEDTVVLHECYGLELNKARCLVDIRRKAHQRQSGSHDAASVQHFTALSNHLATFQSSWESCSTFTGKFLTSFPYEASTAWSLALRRIGDVDRLSTSHVLGGESDHSGGKYNGWTSLHWAAHMGHLDVVRCLVEIGGADIKAMSHTNQTAIDLAKELDNDDILSYLEQQMQNQRTHLDFAPPKSWGVLPKTPTNVLVAVHQWENEYWDVAYKLQETLPDAHISSLWRVQNKALWCYYSFHKHRFAMNGIDPNEVTAWHGTRNVDPGVIYNDTQDGFMMQCSNTGLWGHGLYFAEKSEYSDNYAFQPAQHPNSNLLATERPTASADESEMFLTKLLVGNEIGMNRDESSDKAAECRALTAPPVNAQTNLRYNTVTGHTKGSRVWIVYENGRAYPDYLVRYYRQPRPDLHRTRYGSLEEAQRFRNLAGASHTISSSVVLWEYLDAVAWHPYTASHQGILEDAYQGFVDVNTGRSKLVDGIRIGKCEYQVNLATMVQTNVTHPNRTQRLVQRRVVRW